MSRLLTFIIFVLHECVELWAQYVKKLYLALNLSESHHEFCLLFLKIKGLCQRKKGRKMGDKNSLKKDGSYEGENGYPLKRGCYKKYLHKMLIMS